MLQWRKLIIAGISGLTCGNVYSQAKKHPTIVIPIIEGSALAGACGSILGVGISTYRKLPVHIYAISLGANFAITTLSFLGLRQLILLQSEQLSPQPIIITNHKDFLSSSISGGITASLISFLSWRGVYSLFKASITGIITGLTVQLIYNNIFEQWRKRKALELMYPEQGNKNKGWNRMRNMQNTWLQFWYRTSNAATIEQDILLLEDLIKQERKKLDAIDNELGIGKEPVVMTTTKSPKSVMQS